MMITWNRNRLTARLGIDYPIIQGPLGGLSSQRLTAAVSNFGGLGSFGAHGLAPEEIKDVIAQIRSLTARPFAMNLWVSMEDEGARTSDESAFNRSLTPLAVHLAALGAPRPVYKPYSPTRFEDQARVLLEAKVPAFSFIAGHFALDTAADRRIGPRLCQSFTLRAVGFNKKGGFCMRADMVPGAIFPDYELPDHTAKRRKLSELQGEHPMVLVLGRGGFCPKDRRQAEGLVELHREIEVGYCRLVTISTDNLTETNEYRSGVGAHWPFLSDAGRIVQKDLDIAEYTDPLHNPMIPHVIVLEPGLVVYKIYNGYWFFGRPTLEELRQDLRGVTRKCRPDWDITTPELKAAWQQGRKELFYPYGKTYAQTLAEQD